MAWSIPSLADVADGAAVALADAAADYYAPRGAVAGGAVGVGLGLVIRRGWLVFGALVALGALAGYHLAAHVARRKVLNTLRG